MKLYDHKQFDAYWQKKWEDDSLYTTPRLPGDKKAYILDMFPYPSGEGLHVGHPKGYIATDIYSRFKRMNGFTTLHPMGWDAFGLPAEQFALKNKVHPRVAVEKNVANFKKQLSHIGCDYDWSREINTTDPEFYTWTQWIFTKMYEKGLAYESHEPINWCPSCKTGLANEDLNGNLCERCDSVVEKKPLRQWVLKITDYADRLIKDLDELNWPEGVKTAQKNWIGRTEGAEFTFDLVDTKESSVTVFTTRPDTLFGATFIAISAEVASLWFAGGSIQGDEIKHYITETLLDQKKETDYSVIKEKTGIFTGIYAINPATKEEIPVWIANYVMGGVGTGALMAVPAHDERDYEFAKKYLLPIKQVVVSCSSDSKNPPQDGFKEVKRNTVVVHLRDNSTGKFALLDWHGTLEGITTAIMGGIEDNQTPEDAVINEIQEESGLEDVRIVKKLSWITAAKYCASHKNENRCAHTHTFLAEVDSALQQGIISENEQKLHTLTWVHENEVLSRLTPDHQKHIWKLLHNEEAVTENGYLINSGVFDELDSLESKEKIIEAFGGKKVVKYKLQDWVFARQRYWGEPFPVVRDKDGNVYMVDDSELPVLLPEVEQYEPTGTGESPLAAIDSWVNVKGYVTEKGTFKQSENGEVFTRETNTMPQWAGSSWYYLRFLDPKNKEALIDPEIEKAWGPVDVYVGGDHATRHLIYARFWHKFLYDIGVVSSSEPFSRLEFLGFILAEDGRKMSKRWGNVINPDDVVSEYGADTLRVYEMFMAPFEQTAAWSTSSIKGADKFLDRVYALKDKMVDVSDVATELNKTIKKVGEDIENFKFNTAVSSMMILLNSMESGAFSRADYSTFVKLLAPFAPHLTEQVWHELGNLTSIHKEVWPNYDETKLLEETVTMAIQIGGKMRGTIDITRDSEDTVVLDAVKKHEMYQKYVGESEPKKIIIVKNKIVNIVS